jgi:hypothetical protein
MLVTYLKQEILLSYNHWQVWLKFLHMVQISSSRLIQSLFTENSRGFPQSFPGNDKHYSKALSLHVFASWLILINRMYQRAGTRGTDLS